MNSFSDYWWCTEDCLKDWNCGGTAIWWFYIYIISSVLCLPPRSLTYRLQHWWYLVVLLLCECVVVLTQLKTKPDFRLNMSLHVRQRRPCMSLAWNHGRTSSCSCPAAHGFKEKLLRVWPFNIYALITIYAMLVVWSILYIYGLGKHNNPIISRLIHFPVLFCKADTLLIGTLHAYFR